MCRCTLDRPARAKATHHRQVEPIAALVLFAADRHRDVEIFTDRKAEEFRRRDSDDFHAAAVDTNPRQAGDVAAAELAQPIGMAENDMTRWTRPRVRGLEQPPLLRFDAEYRKDIRAGHDPV